MTLIKQDQIVIAEDKGRIGTRELDLEHRPIYSYEKEIRELKQELSACRTEIQQKNYEIEQCNKIIEHQHKQLEVLSDLLKVENERHSKTKEKLDIFEGWFKEMSEGNDG